MLLNALTTTSVASTVTATVAVAASALIAKQVYLFTASTNSWIRQGSAQLVTCVAKASLATGDFITVVLPDSTFSYQFDLTGSDVLSGNTQVNVSTDTSAIQVAARLRSALLLKQPSLEVTDNGNGTLTVVAPDAIMTITEHVANAGFTVAAATMTATATSGSMYVPLGYAVALNGSQGPQVGVIRDSADGKASVTRCSRF